jgi:hypothetical protein
LKDEIEKKSIETNYDVQFSINSILKDKIKRKSIKKRTQKNHMSQPKLTDQTRDPSHETGITL